MEYWLWEGEKVIDATPCVHDETDLAALNTLMLQLLRVTHIVGIDEAQTRPTAISFCRRCIPPVHGTRPT